MISIIKSLAVGILLVWFMFFILFFFMKGALQVYKENQSYIVSKAIKQRMAYHGTQIVFEDWKGQLYFIRGGKRCKL